MCKYTLKQLIIDSILDYPTLFKDVNYAMSKQKVLNHIFFVNGNGLIWNRGVLCYDTDKDEFPSLTNRSLPDNYFDTPVYEKEEDEAIWLKKFREEGNIPYKPSEACSKTALKIYPICRYAAICNIPDNIQDDFLKGAMEAIDMAIEFYNDPHRYMLVEYCKDWAVKKEYSKIMGYIKRQKQFLQDACDRIMKI